MSERLSVRPVARDDFDRWLPLWQGYNAFYGRSGATALPDEITHVTWSRFFDAYEPVHALVAEDGDHLLGLAHYLFHRLTITIAPTCYLEDLFTAEAARGRGVGRALIGAMRPRRRRRSRPPLLAHPRDECHRPGAVDQVAQRFGCIVYSVDLVPRHVST